MKKSKIALASLLTVFAAVPVLSGCNKNKNKNDEEAFTFSIDIESGKNEIEIGSREKIVLYGNGIDDAERTYTYRTSDASVADINDHGIITAKKEGSVTFSVKEESSGEIAQLVNPVTVVPVAPLSTGGYDYSAASGEEALSTRTNILSKLEKYAMDTHLTGITLFDNGGYVKYAPRVNLPTTEYISGYGFGLLREGSLTGPIASDTTYPNYYHASISQDPLTINAMNNTGSQVSDLASYISSAYFGTKMGSDKKSYEWYPILAKDTVRKPIVDETTGAITGYEANATAQTRPIPMEKKNALDMYKKWRIYLKTGDSNDIKYKASANRSEFNNKKVSLADYAFAYQFLLTGKNGQTRGAEMAGDTTYGIKGAQKFFNATLNETNQSVIDNLWNTMVANGSLGIKTGVDDNENEYIELELVNAIDKFTAMYTLSSSLVSPLPRDFISTIGGGSIIDGAKKYGNFNNGNIEDYVINVGPYYLESWVKEQLITFKRNSDWFEVNADTYRIEGLHYRVIDSSTDIEAVYSQFNNGNLDITGIPSSKIDYESKQERVYKTKGDSTFKLNVNSCTQEQWDALFAEGGKMKTNSKWDVKPYMSNSNFLNGLFFSINRKEFATKRGVQPSINYFSDAYLSDPEKGISYNSTQAHKDAVAAYHTVTYDKNGEETYNDYGYNYDKAVNSFKTAVNQLSKTGGIVKGSSKDNPTIIPLDICWMYQTDPKEYGEDIKNYFETAFNDEAVCGGLVQLKVTNSYVTNWMDVYNEKMMKGQFDLGFGAISGNTYNPLNFLEVLKSDNSSGFTLNWGNDTSLVDNVHPIYYGGKKWSFDGLWEVADHGGIVKDGVKVDPVQVCYQNYPTYVGSNSRISSFYNEQTGQYSDYQVKINLDFIDVSEGVELDFSRLDIYASGVGYVSIPVASTSYDKSTHVVTAVIDKSIVQEIDEGMYNSLYKDDGTDKTHPDHKWKLHPFLQGQYGKIWEYELYYKMTLAGGQESENSVSVKASKNVTD